MPSTPSARALLRAALTLLLVASGASLWAVLARQAPGSPLYLGMLPGPIDAVRNSAALLGVGFLGASWLLPKVANERASWWLVIVACAGAGLDVGAGLYAAVQGLHAVQLVDPRPDIGPIVTLKYLGQALLLGCQLEVTRRVWLRG
jgi:hypothetical protein